ncbi:NAD(P)-dependent oxidoreductase [Myxococcus sp. CA040A]|uniref:NAD(P)-dependent oxidoreductase n=1 Tax=Myxococcus sp. CA040A TaxID=2741738 RepID=UPI00157B22F8|nr:NAD(P)-dependent oxidoreductase [Myxococcus sp. CA040A]NTX07477.1 NAD(P)-dependent oxidoreductase [Myxococcus sp. CA040A]
MNASNLKPVLVIGGSGIVGRRAVKALRELHPELALRIGGRDVSKAAVLARELGRAEAVRIDLERDDLGLAPDAAFSAVVVLLKDDTLRSMKYAQAHGLPYVSFSDFVFDIGPEVALHIQKPTAAPVLFLGHFLGGTVAMSTLQFARGLKKVHSILIGAVFDEEDVGGPAASGDMERLTKGVPSPLIRKDGKFLWATTEEDTTRTFQGADGTQWKGRAYPLLDVATLAAVTDASTVRLDFAVRAASSRPAGQGPGHEVIIELIGELPDGTTTRVRHTLVDGDVHSGLSGRGVALAVERLLGLVGGAPVAPGLYSPEGVLDPAHVVERLKAWGTRIQRA